MKKNLKMFIFNRYFILLFFIVFELAVHGSDLSSKNSYSISEVLVDEGIVSLLKIEETQINEFNEDIEFDDADNTRINSLKLAQAIIEDRISKNSFIIENLTNKNKTEEERLLWFGDFCEIEDWASRIANARASQQTMIDCRINDSKADIQTYRKIESLLEKIGKEECFEYKNTLINDLYYYLSYQIAEHSFKEKYMKKIGGYILDFRNMAFVEIIRAVVCRTCSKEYDGVTQHLVFKMTKLEASGITILESTFDKEIFRAKLREEYKMIEKHPLLLVTKFKSRVKAEKTGLLSQIKKAKENVEELEKKINQIVEQYFLEKTPELTQEAIEKLSTEINKPESTFELLEQIVTDDEEIIKL